VIQSLSVDQQNGMGPIQEPGLDGIYDGVTVIQGVRSMDSTSGQWTTPDAYQGAVDDPMSQKSYMWNRNNSFSYMDPSGYDVVMMYSRDAFQKSDLSSGPSPHFEHLFIEVSDDKGRIKARYSFGPSSAKKPIGSKLVRESASFDASHTAGANTSGGVMLGMCSGTCTKQNGGIDEKGMAAEAATINSAGYTYGLYNSNSAARAVCEGGGGGANCNSLNNATAGGAPGLDIPTAPQNGNGHGQTAN
jgi:hypothetical protein